MADLHTTVQLALEISSLEKGDEALPQIAIAHQLSRIADELDIMNQMNQPPYDGKSHV